ncbi:MAG TPA: flavodoxin [Sphaerochaetaceae bacterium]|nr:flavodoxin [Sphaerochaetaceae bacterium]
MHIAIIYYSSTGNTEAMANLIGEGARNAGAQADVIPVAQCDRSMLESYDRFAFGCPAMGQEELDDTEFLPFYDSVESDLKGRDVALFGSFGWGDGEWMRVWQDRVIAAGANLFEEGLAVQEEPGPESESCRAFGFRFAGGE